MKQSAFDPQQLIITLLGVKFLQQSPGETVVLTPQDMLALAKFTVRLEILHPQTPETSPIACTVISVADAMKMVEELKRAKEVPK